VGRSDSKTGSIARRASLSALLNPHVVLETRVRGEIIARIDGHAANLGKFGAVSADWPDRLRSGVPLASLKSAHGKAGSGLLRLVRRLARLGLMEYRLAGAAKGEPLIVVEPQVPDYWPRTPQLKDTDALVLSRFAYVRRRSDDLIVESPRADAVFRIYDPDVVAALAMLATPRRVGELRRRCAFGLELFALLLDCKILFKADIAARRVQRPTEGDESLALWDFHDLLFHARSTQGRHANPAGGIYPHVDALVPPPAVRPRWPGKSVDLHRSSSSATSLSPTGRLLRKRRSTRSFDTERPVTLAELSVFLGGTARILSKSSAAIGKDGTPIEYTARPYPSAGAAYELELYVTVGACEGLARGFYHYDAGEHALVPIGVDAHYIAVQMHSAQIAMGAVDPPPILVTIAARFGRVSWKYSGIAYALILKDAGALMQTFYLTATDMGLGGCAIGTVDIALFAKMVGIEFHIEGPVGQFALGRPQQPGVSAR